MSALGDLGLGDLRVGSPKPSELAVGRPLRPGKGRGYLRSPARSASKAPKRHLKRQSRARCPRAGGGLSETLKTAFYA